LKEIQFNLASTSTLLKPIGLAKTHSLDGNPVDLPKPEVWMPAAADPPGDVAATVADPPCRGVRPPANP